jgi:hypothetical protein
MMIARRTENISSLTIQTHDATGSWESRGQSSIPAASYEDPGT